MIAWGIDAGSSSTKFVKLLVDDRGVEIMESGSYENKDAGPTLVFPPSPQHELWKEHEFGDKDQVAISVPGRKILARFVKLPPVDPKRIPDIVAFEARQQIPWDLDGIELYYHKFPRDLDMPDTEIGIFGIKKELLTNTLNQFEDAGFEAVHIAQATPIALYNALHYAKAFKGEPVYLDGSDTPEGEVTEKDKYTVVLDIGYEDTQLIIVANGSIWTRTIPVAGKNLIEEICKEFKLSETKAKKMLETVEESKYARQIFEAYRPIYGELVAEIQRSIGFFGATHRDQKPGKMIVAGGCVRIPGMIKYLEHNLGLPNHISFVADIDNFPRREDYWVAYGLALQAAGLAEIDGQFIPTQSSIKAVPMAIARAFSKICVPNFVKQMTFIEVAIVTAIVGLLISIFVPVFIEKDKSHSGLQATNQWSNELLETQYALIKVEMSTNGTVTITPEYSPAYDEYNVTDNPLSHRLIKNIMETLVLQKIPREASP